MYVCMCVWVHERCISGFGGGPDINRPLGRPGHRWEDNIKMDLKKLYWLTRTGLT